MSLKNKLNIDDKLELVKEKERLKLIVPTNKYKEQVMEYRKIFLENEVIDEVSLSKSGVIQRYWISF